MFNSSSANAEEIIIYLIISCYVIGIGLGEFGNSHIRATVVTDLLGHRTRQVASFISAGSTLLFAGLMIWYGIEVAIQRYDIGEVSATSLKFPSGLSGSQFQSASFWSQSQFYRAWFHPHVNGLWKRVTRYPDGPGADMLIYIPILLLAVLLVLGTPVYVSLGLAATTGFLLVNFPLGTLADVFYNSLTPAMLLAVPFFIITAKLMTEGGISDSLVRFAKAWVGPFQAAWAWPPF